MRPRNLLHELDANTFFMPDGTTRNLDAKPVIDAHRVAEKLWVGSAPMPQDCMGFFDVVVLCAQEYQPSGFPCRVLHAGFDDALEPTRQDLHTADAASRAVNIHRAAGRRVLVSCVQGRNRSALVAALCLVKQGLAPALAVAQLRRLRKPPTGGQVLSNPAFVRFIDHVGKQTIRP